MIYGEPARWSSCLCADVIILPLLDNQGWLWVQLICSGHLVFFQNYSQQQKNTHKKKITLHSFNWELTDCATVLNPKGLVWTFTGQLMQAASVTSHWMARF